MKLLHTADWHLGRILHQVALLEDQAWVLERFLELARHEKPDAILLAGDIYDRAVPPADAVELLDHVLGALVLGMHIPVIAIAGNHDGPERLAFGRSLLCEQGLHLTGPLRADPVPVRLADSSGPVQIWSVPYAEPARVREVLACADARDHDSAMRLALDRIRAQAGRGTRSVLVAHAYVTGGAPSDSERPLALGGAGMVDAGRFSGFDYVALGHLHRPQSVGGDRVRYAGSPLKYSFSEADDVKSAAIVELNAKGAVKVRPAPLGAKRDLRRVSGALADLLAAAGSEDYLEITLTDTGPVHDAMGRLRERFPNVLHVRTAGLSGAGGPAGTAPDIRTLTEEALFASFFEQVAGVPLTPEEQAEVADAIAAVRRRDRA